jgi:AraC family transcriptional regulator, transcriptional activator of pobA
MYKSVTSGIKKYNLDTSLHRLHKEGTEKNDFGMDNSTELLDGGFGLYSTANTKKSIGPIKTEYYRVALVRSGSAAFTIGLETFYPVRNGIIFGFPGQLFSLQEMTPDFFTYYMLFSESFIADSLLLKNHHNQFPFLTYSGVPCFPLTEEEGNEIEAIIGQMNDEVKNRKANSSQAIRLYIQLIFIKASRSYTHKILSRQGSGDSSTLLFSRFVKLVSEHFLTAKKVSDYAAMLHVSADHLNRTIKTHSDKTAHELIDEMVVRETKAYLLHSKLSVAEIGYQLGFSDPSHFNKFFKKLSGFTPLQYRNRSAK